MPLCMYPKIKNKLDSRYEKCIFNMFKDGMKGYALLNVVTRKKIFSWYVIFIEFEGTSKIEEDKI